MGMMYLFLPEGRNLDGLEWAAGPHMLNDDGKGWCRVLREIGAREITEEQYLELTTPKAAPAAVAAPSITPPPTTAPSDNPVKEATNGSDDTGGNQRDQISAADSIRANRPGRRYRRVA